MGQAGGADRDAYAGSRHTAGGAVKGLVVMGVHAADFFPGRSFAARLEAFRDDESGATAIEYGLIVALIFIAIVAAINSYSASTSDMYNRITTTLDEAGS